MLTLSLLLPLATFTGETNITRLPAKINRLFMMTSGEIRQQFMDFFKSKEHAIVPSAPIVVKNDPTLMFTNAGMNQFKDIFLGNKPAQHKRVADTQKCLRVSGKHNDLEEVGVDTYHHTMFEMLGNWSFGDYFKKEAIEWSWELLTKVYAIPEDRLYVTIFEGDKKENLPKDDEAFSEWKKWVADERILLGNKKDNFWEMGDTGPCGPCSEIHVDCRPDEERKKKEGKDLVNNDHPQVIEIWNNVFIQFNRLKDGSLESLPAKHVDTGLGLERLVRVLQNKNSNYDTDIFTGTITAIEKIVNKNYKELQKQEDSLNPLLGGRGAIAFRVLADHIRAIAFTIADGQLPSNTGAGYVIRRILRRAVRYYYTYLGYKQPLLHQLMPTLAKQFETVFPELNQQLDFVSKVVKEEEESFLRTLESGIKLFNFSILENIKENLKENLTEINISEDVHKQMKAFEKFRENLSIANAPLQDSIKELQGTLKIKYDELEKLLGKISGSTAFKLQDTYGFPLDLTKLLAKEIKVNIDEAGFEKEMQQQKQRSRAATAVDTEDWVVLDDFARQIGRAHV